MSISSVVLSPELIRKTIEENNYLPENAKDHITTEEFKAQYGLEKLKSFEKGNELLEFLFGTKGQNKNSMTYSLEENVKITSYFAKMTIAAATSKTLNYSNDTWNRLREKISTDEAIDLAYSIRNSLISILEKITDRSTATEIKDLIKSENLSVGQGWIRKYFTILYPDKFMPMSNDDWTNRIFVPLGLKQEKDWYKNAQLFSEKAKEFNTDSVNLYHVVCKCVSDQVICELNELGIDPEELANPINLLITTKDAFDSPYVKIESEEIRSKFEEYLSKRYSWDGEEKSFSATENSVKNAVQINNDHIKKYVNKLKKSSNIIFRGAPGTGKSYLAKQIAANIISGKTDYKDLTVEQKKQVEFVQFHPSYDYSDFVEGLRPVDNGNGGIGFELKDGIFKDFVKRARENFEKSTSDSIVIKKIQTNDAIESFLDDAMLSGTTFTTKKGRPFIIDDFNDNYIKISIPENLISNQVTLNRNKLQRLLESEENFDNVKKIQKALGKNGASQSASYFFVLYEEIRKLIGKSTETTFVKEEEKPFVFIIDEINRGEISKIFGELFYSIEPSKRGKDGEIATQYANMHPDEELFYIPENVYIIGTMNDIDRSVDSFDFAMRRRFKFIEITSEESQTMLDAGITDVALREEAKTRMNRLNASIKEDAKLNSNYFIGASYFMNIEKESDFEELWNDNLQPLLQEYIVGSYGADEIMEKLKFAYDGKKEDEQDDENNG